MKKLGTNKLKKLAVLRYKDEILSLHKDGHSISAITQKINYKLVRTALKVTLSRTTIYNTIKKYKDKQLARFNK